VERGARSALTLSAGGRSVWLGARTGSSIFSARARRARPDLDGPVSYTVGADRGSAQERQQLVRTTHHPPGQDLASCPVEDRDRRLARMHVQTDPADAVTRAGTSS
jgi:hypothetical protein